jgi:folate-binding protein YgfZ
VAPATGDDSRRQAAADPTMVQGAAAPTMPDGLPPLLSGAGDGSAFDLFRGRRGAGESWECVFPLTHAAEVERILRARLRSIREPGPAFWLRARITAGIPSVPRDAGPTDLPQEVGLVSAAVSFNKGCYLGQEIMARLKTRGRVRRQLAPVRIQGAAGGLLPLPHDGSPLRLFGTGTSLDDSNRPGVAGRPDGATVARPLGEIRSWVPASGEGGLLPLEPNLALAMLPVDIRFPAQFALSPGRETAIALTAL